MSSPEGRRPLLPITQQRLTEGQAFNRRFGITTALGLRSPADVRTVDLYLARKESNGAIAEIQNHAANPDPSGMIFNVRPLIADALKNLEAERQANRQLEELMIGHRMHSYVGNRQRMHHITEALDDIFSESLRLRYALRIDMTRLYFELATGWRKFLNPEPPSINE